MTAALRYREMWKTRVALVVLAWCARAHAQPRDVPDDVDAPADPEPSDDGLGPLLVIERIDVEGNTATQDHVVRRALPIQANDAVRASDKRLAASKYKVLALGYFRDVTLRLTKGSARGRVILVVTVIERGTVVLNHLWFGSNSLSRYWLGADLSERNLLGLGIAVGGGLIYSGFGEVEGGRDQWAGELRFAVPTLHGSRFGANASLTLVHGAEAFRISGSDADPDVAELRAFGYRRFGGRVGVTYDVTGLTRLSAGARTEQISAEPPSSPTLVVDGVASAIDLHLKPGTSQVTTIGFGYDRDTRPDPILSHSGAHVAFGAELGSALSDYQFATLFGRYEQFWPLRGDHHAIALKIAGGVVIGNAPRFERIHVADVDRMLTPRALGLVLSTASPLEILGTKPSKPSYGDLGGHVTVEYAMQLFRGTGRARVYGSDLFVGAGLWGLAETTDLRARDSSLRDALPIDVYVDAGLRIDTDLGIFELTLANALGRIR